MGTSTDLTVADGLDENGLAGTNLGWYCSQWFVYMTGPSGRISLPLLKDMILRGCVDLYDTHELSLISVLLAYTSQNG